MTRFSPGRLVERREVLHGRPWSVIPMRVSLDPLAPPDLTPTRRAA